MVYRSSLGFIKINISNGFINEVSFIKNGKEPEQLTDTKTSPAADKKILQKCKQQLDEYFSGKRKIFDLPIYQEGTGFQQKVWQELIQIPYGKTITYLQLGQRMGNIKAIRAAAAANGRNRLWIIVPCHRVIGSNGSLTGYAGGLPMKKWLLEHENKYANGVSLLF